MGSRAFTETEARMNSGIVAALKFAGQKNHEAIDEGNNCRGMGVDMFPERAGLAAPAKALCLKCDVRPQCLADALNRGDLIGVFGGLTGEERSRWRGAWNKLKSQLAS